jgi:hypothetical protein
MTNRFAVAADPEALVLEGDFRLKARINKGLVFNDIHHVAKEFHPFLALYGDKIRRPHKVSQALGGAGPGRGLTGGRKS